MGLILGIFHHIMARRISVRQPRRRMDGSWTYPLLEGNLQGAGMETMETYISRRHNMVTHYIVTQPIFDLCLEAEQRTGSRVPMRW